MGVRGREAFNQFLGNLDILERVVQATTGSNPERKVTQGRCGRERGWG